jgi:hypothetical protein
MDVNLDVARRQFAVGKQAAHYFREESFHLFPAVRMTERVNVRPLASCPRLAQPI